jgi:hypothetical protein
VPVLVGVVLVVAYPSDDDESTNSNAAVVSFEQFVAL